MLSLLLYLLFRVQLSAADMREQIPTGLEMSERKPLLNHHAEHYHSLASLHGDDDSVVALEQNSAVTGQNNSSNEQSNAT